MLGIDTQKTKDKPSYVLLGGVYWFTKLTLLNLKMVWRKLRLGILANKEHRAKVVLHVKQGM